MPSYKSISESHTYAHRIEVRSEEDGYWRDHKILETLVETKVKVKSFLWWFWEVRVLKNQSKNELECRVCAIKVARNIYPSQETCVYELIADKYGHYAYKIWQNGRFID